MRLFRYTRQMRWATMLLVGALLGGLTGCAKKEPAVPTYTFHEYLTEKPVCWDPAVRTSVADCYFASYTEIGLVDAVYDPTTGGAKWAYEMALSVSDVTSEHPEIAEKYGVTGTTGIVWEIALNPGACWADGEAITAADYIASMRRLLDDERAEAQSGRFCTGSAALAGADGYRRNRDAGEAVYSPLITSVSDGVLQQDPVYTEGAALYWNPEVPCALLSGETLLNEMERYRTDYDCFAALDRAYQPQTYRAVTDEIRELLEQVAKLYGYTDENAWKGFCAFQSGVRLRTEWDQVGLFAGANGETLYYVCAAETTEAELFAQLAQNWLVDCRLASEDYGTSIETYSCYGPYRIVSISDDRLVLTRNESWYGYSDGRHENLYQTTDIVCRIEQNQNEILRLFDAGQLDVAALPAENDAVLVRYSDSVNLLRTESTYTDRLIFVTDRDVLRRISEEDPAGGSRLILSDPDFRRAISDAVDRARFASAGAVKDRPALGLFSNAYFAGTNDVELYRMTEPARRVLENVYGTDPDGRVTGYDPVKAASRFTTAFERAVQNGDLAPGETLTLRIAVAGETLTDAQRRQMNLLQADLDAATVGTPLENRLKIVFVPTENRYAAISGGEVEMAIGAWGGAPDRPDSLIRCYTDPTYTEIHEQCGFSPLTETCTITVNGETQTHTFYEWGASLNAGGLYEQADADTRLAVRAGLEQALLERCAFVVLTTECSASLFSDQIYFPSDYYNPLCGYGGIRSMHYYYSDAKWDAYVRRQGGVLDYTAKE